MQKAIAKKKSKVKAVSRRTRQYYIKGGQVRLSATRRGKLRNGTNAASNKHLVPFALKPIEKPISYLTVQELIGEKTEYSSESEQLKIIKDVYPIISSLKDFKLIEFDQLTNTADVLTHLFQEFDRIGQFERWSLIKENDRFKIKALRLYGGEQSIHIAVDFLSQINRTHIRLHDFIIWAIRLVGQYNSIPAFQSMVYDKYAGETYEYFLDREQDIEGEEEEEDRKRYYDTKDYYSGKGIPLVYSRLLTSGASLKIYKKELEKFIPENKFEEYAFPFLQAALELAETKKHLHSYCDEPWEAGEAKPSDYMRIVWSWDDDDLMYQTLNEVIDSMAQGCGVVGFCWEAKLDKKGTFEDKNEDTDFCDKVEAFFYSGNEMSKQIKKELNGIYQQSPLSFNNKVKHV